jgi:hypothetical protein
MFCAPGLVFGCIESVGSRFNVLRSRTYFRWSRRRPLPFSCFASPDTFSTVPWASGNVFMFCTPGLVFGGTEGVGSCFHILPARTNFRRYRGCRVPFSCFVRPDSFFGGPEGVGSRFHVLHFRTNFRWFRGRRFLFSCFASPY